MRALPSVSFEYFGDTAVGKTALPAAAGAADGLAAGVAVGAEGCAAVGVAAGDVSEPHSALRKSFHF